MYGYYIEKHKFLKLFFQDLSQDGYSSVPIVVSADRESRRHKVTCIIVFFRIYFLIRPTSRGKFETVFV